MADRLSARGSGAFATSLQNGAKHESFIVFFVFGGEEQRNGAALRFERKGAQRRGSLLQLLFIAPAEFGPAGRIVSKPFTKLGAGRDVFEPEIYGSFFLAQTARPKPIDQNAFSIGFVGGQV